MICEPPATKSAPMAFPAVPNEDCAGRSQKLGPAAATLFALALSIAVVEPTWGVSAPDVPKDGHVENVSHLGSVDVNTHVDRSSAQIADRITLTLEVRAPTGVQVFLPPKPEKLGPFDVVHVTDSSDIPVEGGRLWTRVYTLESLVSGDLTIPSIPIPCVDKRCDEAVRSIVSSNEITVSVTSLLEGRTDTSQFRDIKGLVPIERRTGQDRHFWFLVSGIGTMLAGASALFLVKRRRTAELTPEQWALGELIRVETQAQTGQVDAQALYSDLTIIVRIYIDGAFGIAAPRLTTAEFFDHVQSHREVGLPQARLLREFLERADIVKFAGMVPSATDVTEACSKARMFVEASASEATLKETP